MSPCQMWHCDKCGGQYQTETDSQACEANHIPQAGLHIMGAAYTKGIQPPTEIIVYFGQSPLDFAKFQIKRSLFPFFRRFKYVLLQANQKKISTKNVGKP